jgi:hypothetical protein
MGFNSAFKGLNASTIIVLGINREKIELRESRAYLYPFFRVNNVFCNELGVIE